MLRRLRRAGWFLLAEYCLFLGSFWKLVGDVAELGMRVCDAAEDVCAEWWVHCSAEAKR